MELRRDCLEAKKVQRAPGYSLLRSDEMKQNTQSIYMHYVYYLEAENGDHWYVGVTNDLQRRFSEHNGGKSVHTNKFKPWKLRMYTLFNDRNLAEAFERYLKSHSGRAFIKKHLGSM